MRPFHAYIPIPKVQAGEDLVIVDLWIKERLHEVVEYAL